MLCERSHSTRVPIDPDRLHEIKHDGHRLIVQREGSHASAATTTTTTTTTTSLSGRFDISV
jgi:alanine dehydrogenase